MPNWKKVLVSGSNAELNHVTASGNVSGSSTVTGSFGEVRVAGMSVTSLTTFSSSIATKFNTLDADLIALSIALG
tara:strand:+ start:358 stop:582 length:225 start_codon:yes stop_codon:yes gene_type:complete